MGSHEGCFICPGNGRSIPEVFYWCPAEITVGGCNCLQEWKDTDPDTGLYMEVRNGSCAKTEMAGLPWCYVDKKTCVGEPLLRNGYYWDTCFPDGKP